MEESGRPARDFRHAIRLSGTLPPSSLLLFSSILISFSLALSSLGFQRRKRRSIDHFLKATFDSLCDPSLSNIN